jgi:hypothetical protein
MSIRPLVPLLAVHSSELCTKPFTPAKWTRHASDPTLMLWSLKCCGEDIILPNTRERSIATLSCKCFHPICYPTTAGLLNVMPLLFSDEDTTSTSTLAAPSPTPAPETTSSAPPSGPITQARAREFNFVMMLKNEGPKDWRLAQQEALCMGALDWPKRAPRVAPPHPRR